jgi:hypothetical protein
VRAWASLATYFLQRDSDGLVLLREEKVVAESLILFSRDLD